MILMTSIIMAFQTVLLGFQSFLAQKTAWAWAFFLATTISVVMPVEKFIYCAFLAVFADSMCGWAAAAKRGEGFQGKKTRETLVKLMLYVVVIITFYWVSKNLEFPVDITYFVVSMISIAELMSILRNLGDYSGYDYEDKVRQYAPFIADFLPKTKNIVTGLLLCMGFFAQAQTPVRPDQAPILTNPNATNAEVYTQKGGTAIKRIPYDVLQKSIAPLALPLSSLTYNPSSTGNPTTDRGKIVSGSNGYIYYIDWEGRGIKLGGSYSPGAGINISPLGVISAINSGTGIAGTNGRTVLNGITAPATNVGVPGDFYINTDTWIIFGPKTSQGWGTGTSLVGAAGTNGSPGVQGNPGTPGVAGAPGANGVGVPAGGTAGQVLSKINATDYNTQWINAASGGGTYTAGSGIGISTANVITADDSSPTNEAQSLSQSGQVVTLSNVGTVTGGSFTLPTVPTTIDASATDLYEFPNPTGNAGLFLKSNLTGDGYVLVGGSPGAVSVPMLNGGNQLHQAGTAGSVGALPHPIAGINTSVSTPTAANGWAVNVTGVDVSASDVVEIPAAPSGLNGLHLVWDNHATPPAAKWESTVLGASAGSGITFGGPTGTTIAANDPSLTNEIQTLSAAAGNATGTNLATTSRAFKSITLSSIGVQTGTTSQGVPIITQTGGGSVEIEDRYNTFVSSSISSTGVVTTVQDSGGGSKTNVNGGFGTAAATSLLGFNLGSPVVNTVSSVLSANTVVGNSLNTTNQLITTVNGVASTPLTLPTPAGDNWGTDIVNVDANYFKGNGTFNSPLELEESGVVANTYNSVTVDPKGIVTAGSNIAAPTLASLTPSGSILGSDCNTIVPLRQAIVGTGVYSSINLNAPINTTQFYWSVAFNDGSSSDNIEVYINNVLQTCLTCQGSAQYDFHPITSGASVEFKVKVTSFSANTKGLQASIYYKK